MTENIPQASASERMEETCEALADFDSRTAALGPSVETSMERRMAACLRAFVAPASNHQSEQEIVERIMIRTKNALHPDRSITLSPDEYQRALAEAVRAGVLAAHGSVGGVTT